MEIQKKSGTSFRSTSRTWSVEKLSSAMTSERDEGSRSRRLTSGDRDPGIYCTPEPEWLLPSHSGCHEHRSSTSPQKAAARHKTQPSKMTQSVPAACHVFLTWNSNKKVRTGLTCQHLAMLQLSWAHKHFVQRTFSNRTGAANCA
jgi:hypothetical protein